MTRHIRRKSHTEHEEDYDTDKEGNSINNVSSQDFTGATEKTISSGAITVNQTLHTVDTEADASSDDLNTINGGSEGNILYLSLANVSRKITLKHGIGNIVTWSGGDFELKNGNVVAKLIYSGGNWHLVSPTQFSGATYMYPSANKTAPTSTIVQAELDTESYDKLDWGDTGAWDITIPEDGRYFLVGHVAFSGLSSGDKAFTKIYVNGSPEYEAKMVKSGAAILGSIYSQPQFLHKNDVLTLYGYHDHGSDATLYKGETTFFAVFRM